MATAEIKTLAARRFFIRKLPRDRALVSTKQRSVISDAQVTPRIALLQANQRITKGQGTTAVSVGTFGGRQSGKSSNQLKCRKIFNGRLCCSVDKLLMLKELCLIIGGYM